MNKNDSIISSDLSKQIMAERKNEIKRHVEGLPIKEVENILDEVLHDIKQTTVYTLPDTN